MDPDFWQQKWARNDIGFHQPEPHPMLRQHWPALGLAPASRIFVPLCGKSNDLVWLHARGHEVVGIELSDIAVTAFFAENGIAATRAERGPFTLFTAPGYTVFCGDYFALSSALLGPVAALYDRAALIALPPAMRARYAAHLTALATPAARMLLVTVDYDARALNPPPFLVTVDEVSTLYASSWRVASLGQAAAEVKGQPATEAAFALQRP